MRERQKPGNDMNRFIFILAIILIGFIMQAQTFYSDMAAQYAAEGNYEKAIELEKEGLEIWERLKGKKNLEYATSLSKLATYNSYLGNYQEAIRLRTEALEIFEEILGKNHPDYATSLNNLALYNDNLGNY